MTHFFTIFENYQKFVIYIVIINRILHLIRFKVTESDRPDYFE